MEALLQYPKKDMCLKIVGSDDDESVWDVEKRVLLLSAASWAQMFLSVSAESLGAACADCLKLTLNQKWDYRGLHWADRNEWLLPLLSVMMQSDRLHPKGVIRLAHCQEEWCQHVIWLAMPQEGWDQQHCVDGLTHLLFFLLPASLHFLLPLILLRRLLGQQRVRRMVMILSIIISCVCSCFQDQDRKMVYKIYVFKFQVPR